MHERLCVLIAAALLGPAAFAADGTGGYAGIDLGRTDGDSAARVALGGAWTTEAPTLVTHVTGPWSNDLSPSGGAFTGPVYSERFSQDLDFDTLRIGMTDRF